MAYVPQVQTDEEEKQRQDQLLAASGVPGAAGAGGAALPAGAQPSPTSGASGNYTNLQRYLDENKSQAGDLAQKVAGTVTSAGEEAKTAAQNVADEGNKEIQAARVPENTGLVDEAAKTPTSVAADAAKTADFQKERDAAYTGPTGLDSVQGFQSAQDLVRKAQEKAGLTDTEAGRTTLLSDMGGPGYGQGKADLNQLLLSGNPDAAATVSAAAQPYKNLQDFLAGQNTTAQASAADAAKEAAATQQDIQTRFNGPGGVIPTETSDLLAKLDAAKGGSSAAAKAASDALAKWEPTDQDLATLGMTRDQYNVLLGYNTATSGAAAIDPTAYLTTQSPDAQFSMANVASPDDYAREAALESLMGTTIPNLDPANAAEAGTAPKSLINYDVPGATSAAKSSFQSYWNNPLTSVQAALAINPGNTFNLPPLNNIRNYPSLQSMAGGDAFTALTTLGQINYLYTNGNDPAALKGLSPTIQAQWKQVADAVAPLVQSPLFQALYQAAKTARATQPAGTPPAPLINYLPPQYAAMLK